MKDFIKRLGKERLIFDGGMGTLLQDKGIAPGELPELWNITKREAIFDIHKSYIASGCHVLKANTFGANRLKLSDSGYSVKQTVSTGVAIAKDAAGSDCFVALDIGPTGKLLAPFGDLEFEVAVDIYAEIITAGASAGADLVLIETMSDTYEIKAAMLAAKENCNLPVLVTFTPDERGRLLTGGDVLTAICLIEGLGADALGVNCGLGPTQMHALIPELLKCASIPIIVNPNAGMPELINGKTIFRVTPEEFAREMADIASYVQGIGGCCGTTPAHISEMVRACGNITFKPNTAKNYTAVSSYRKSVVFKAGTVIIGERINPTGKPRMKQALRENDMDYLYKEGIDQIENGADILDVNVGMPGIDEKTILAQVVLGLQSVAEAPLQIDTADATAAERALRLYNGKPLLNSVNGKKESLKVILPLVKKYGAVVVGLTLDEDGIPETVSGRVKIAEKIIAAAESYGIPKKNIIVDALTMTISTSKDNAQITLETLEYIRKKLGIHTVLGVSNVSFGLPERERINAGFFTLAMSRGLSAGIVNPMSAAMMDAFYTFKALSGEDSNCGAYINRFSIQERRADEIETKLGIQTGNTGTKQGLSTGNTEIKTDILPERISDIKPDVKSDVESDVKSDVKPDTKSEENEVKNKLDTEEINLYDAVVRGLREQAGRAASAMAANIPPMEIINGYLISALNKVGKDFENGLMFLPQLLMSAEAAKVAFEAVKLSMLNQGEIQEKRGKIVLATVKDDVHDIGKNIIKVLLENYNFQVIDLGKNVEPEKIVETVRKEQARLVGLSALMTTTVVNMEKTIRLLREAVPDCSIMVGGAVLTKEYADDIGADFYSKDAMGGIWFAEKLFSK